MQKPVSDIVIVNKKKKTKKKQERKKENHRKSGLYHPGGPQSKNQRKPKKWQVLRPC